MKVNSKQLLNRTVVALYLGESVEWKIGCTRDQMKALAEALVATKAFDDVLTRDDVTLEAVSSALRTKHAYAKAFEREFRQPWPL